jgi:hypothetical protein
MPQDLPAGNEARTTPAPAEAEAAQIRTRRLMFMSKGPMVALAGVFICALAGFGWAATAFPDIRTYAVPLGAAAGLTLGLLNLGIERARARSACHVRTLRKATLRENLGLAAAILSGVVALVLLDASLPEAFNRDWAWLAFLGLIGLGFSGYFLFLAKRLSLFEPALMGLGMLVLFALGLYTHFIPLQKEEFQLLLTGLEAGFGLLLIALGISLHRRWTMWRAQAMEASGKEQA